MFSYTLYSVYPSDRFIQKRAFSLPALCFEEVPKETFEAGEQNCEGQYNPSDRCEDQPNSSEPCGSQANLPEPCESQANLSESYGLDYNSPDPCGNQANFPFLCGSEFHIPACYGLHDNYPEPCENQANFSPLFPLQNHLISRDLVDGITQSRTIHLPNKILLNCSCLCSSSLPSDDYPSYRNTRFPTCDFFDFDELPHYQPNVGTQIHSPMDEEDNESWELQSGRFRNMIDWIINDGEYHQREAPPSWLKYGRKIASFDQRFARAYLEISQCPEFWDMIHSVIRRLIPRLPPLSPNFKQAIITVFSYYAFDSTVSAPFYLNLEFLKTRMSIDEIMIVDFFHSIFLLTNIFLSFYRRNRKINKRSKEELQANDFTGDERGMIIRSLDRITSFIMPSSNVSLLNLMSTRLRLLTQLKGVMLDFVGLLSWVLKWIIDAFRHHFIGVHDGLKTWIDKVDSIEEVYQKEQGDTTTLRAELTKSRVSRLQVLSLLSQGRQFMRKSERHEIPSDQTKPIQDRVRKLEKIISGNLASFVGCEGKMKPYTMYIYGVPGIGKTVMVPQLAHDLCTVLGEPDFDKSRDIYAVMSNTPYHDQYAYQRFAVCNDVFQMKDPEYRNNEIFNLIQMTDESPYPLNIAECSGKGTVYFSSPFVVLTSNFDIDAQQAELQSRMTDPEALKRRMNVFIKVEPPDIDRADRRFQRNAMKFTVRFQDQKAQSVDWWGLIRLLRLDIMQTFSLSDAISKVDVTPEEEEMLQKILKDVQEPQDNNLPEVSHPIPGPSRRLNIEDILSPEELQKVRQEGSYVMETQSGFPFSDDYIVPNFDAYSWLLKPLPAPSFALKFAAGEYPPYCVFDQRAALYLTWYKRQQKALKGLRFLCGLSSALAGFALIKSLISWAMGPNMSETTQAVITTSGGNYEAKPSRRILQPRRPDKFKRMELLEASDSYGWQSSNGPLVQSKIVKNIALVRNGSRQVNGMFVFGHVVMLPLHIFDAVETDTLAIVLPNSITFQLHMQDLTNDEVLVSENRHLVFINLARQLTYYHSFSDLRSYFLEFKEDADYISRLGYMCTMRPDSEYTAMLYQIPLSDIQPDCNEASIKDQKFHHVYTIVKSLRAHVRSARGDCGSLWVLDRGSNGGAKIAGVHIAGEPTLELGRAAILTRKMIDNVAKYFRHGEPKLPKINHGEQTLLPEVEQLQSYDAIDILGTAEVKFHQASRSDLRASVWDGLRPHTTAPAPLKSFRHPDGSFITPQLVSFRRYAGERKGIPDSLLRRAVSYLSDWYPMPTRKERRVLTIEEAVFGEPDGYNPSIKTDTSLGYPWNLTYKKRTQLFTLEPQWISDELRQACQHIMDTGELDMVIIDALKDERISLEKANKGDTRIFMILPFHVNIVLKQLYGDFIHYLQKRWTNSPVKVGISPLPDDWTVLAEWLTDNGGSIVAGDYGGWDRKVHYEIMMTIVDWINEWYSDDKQALRRKIAQQIFQSYHYLFGTIYRSDGGMPSGCYLTTPFNSIANVLYWYAFMLTVLEEDDMIGHTYWFRPAVYGDDHVISIRDHPNINAQTFGTWITSLGLRYTDAAKNIPQFPYQELHEVTFLKRAFIFRNNRVWGPLEQHQLYEMIQWYRDSPATRVLSLRELSKQILETVLSEAYFHGRDFFDSFREEAIKYAYDRASLDLSDNPYTFEFFEQRFGGREANVTNWTSFGTWSLIPRLLNERFEANDEELPRETASQALSHVETSIPDSGETSNGLQATPRNPVSNERVVADTLISDPQAVIETSALSQYRDAQRVEKLSFDSTLVPVVDANFIFPKGYFELAERSIPITTLIIPMTTPTTYPLFRLDPLNVILGSDLVNNKLNYARYLRFEMEIQIKILATNFHYGQLMAVFRPAYFPFLKIQRTFNENDHFYDCKVLKDQWNGVGPYDTVFTASQLPHSVIPVTAGNSITIRCPWALNYQYAPVSELLSPRFHLGILDVYSITEVAPSDADPPTLQIFARLSNIQGFGYQSAENPCLPPPAARITPNKYMMEDGSEDSFFKIPVHQPSAGNIMNRIQARESMFPLSTMTADSTVVARWNGSITLKEREQYQKAMQTKFGNDKTKWTPIRQWMESRSKQSKERLESGELTEILSKTISNPVSGLFSTINSFVGTAQQLLGLSKPLLETPVGRVINIAPPIANAIGEDFTTSTAYHSQCEVHKPRKLHSDKIQLSNLAATPMYVGYVKFTTTDRVATFLVAPHTVVSNAWKDAYVMMPAGYIASRFAYWRGALKYWFHFSSSSFINARFQITMAFRNLKMKPGIVPTQYVEIKGDAIAKGVIPFLWPTQWAEFMNEDFEWTINVTLQDGTPVAWKKDEATPIMCSVWFAFEDFQVAQPSMNLCQAIPWGFAKYFEGTHPVNFADQKRYIRNPPLHSLVSKEKLPPAQIPPPLPSKEELQSLDVPGTIPVKKSFDVGMNDIPSSVYHIAKRYQSARATLFVPHAPMTLITTGTVFNGNYCVTYNGAATWFSALFRWVSGSTTIVSSNFESILDVPLFGSAYEQYVHDSTLYKNDQINLLMGQYHPFLKRFGEKIIALRQPYRSNVPFISGPHIYYTWDEASSYAGIHIHPMCTGVYPYEGIQGLWFSHDVDDANKATFSWAFADDLCYNLYMGVPVMTNLVVASLAEAIYGPPTL